MPTRRREPLARDLPAELQVTVTNGSTLTDSRGKKYIDFVMGWCVGNFGWRVPDAGDASYEGEVREEQAREAENASDTLKEVRLALARTDAGTFGLCEKGGEHIDEKRLEAIPWTRYCSAHEAEAAASPGPRRVTL